MSEYMDIKKDTSSIRESMRFQIIDNLETWKRAESEWNDLINRSIAPSVFLTFEYLHSAWEAYGHDAALHIVKIYAGETLLGVVPLKISSRRVCGIPSTTLQPIGGEEAEGSYFIVIDQEVLFYEAVIDYLTLHFHLWSKVFFNLLNIAHPFTNLFCKKFSTNRKLIVERKDCFAHPYITINESWEQYLEGLNNKFIHNLRTKVGKASHAGKLHVVCFRSPADISTYLDVYVELEQRSWKTSRDSGITRTENLHTLYRHMLSRCAQGGWAELTFLMLDGRLLAGGIGLKYCDRYTYLQTVYDSSTNQFSPGLILMTINVWRMYQSGLKIVDFMGNYVDYKRNWAQDEWQSCTVCVRKRYSCEGLAYLGACWVKPAAAWLSSRLTTAKELSKAEQQPSPLVLDPASLTKQHIILNNDDITAIFQIKNAHHQDQLSQGIATFSMPDDEIDRLIVERSKARSNKNWNQADAIRDLLLEHGVILHDTPLSTEWSRTSHDL